MTSHHGGPRRTARRRASSFERRAKMRSMLHNIQTITVNVVMSLKQLNEPRSMCVDWQVEELLMNIYLLL